MKDVVGMQDNLINLNRVRCSENPLKSESENPNKIRVLLTENNMLRKHLFLKQSNDILPEVERLIWEQNMSKHPRRVALYCRVSTDNQTIENQLQELQAVATRHNWEVVKLFKDEGISGSKGREKRPGFDELCKGVTRKEFDLVAVWSVDRLGRSLPDLIAFMQELHGKGVDLYLHQQGIDTTTPGGRAMFQMMGVFAEFERAMIQERVRAGLNRAKAQGKTLGRPKVSTAMEKSVIEAKQAGKGIRKIAAEVGTSPATVIRILDAAGIEREKSPQKSRKQA